jgi:predicted ATPase
MFVGRKDELKQLQQGLEQAKSGQGNIIFITGEAGVGKTRLATELETLKVSFDFEFLMGQCIYHEGVDPYLPFIDMFKGYLTEHPYIASAIMASFNSPVGVIFNYYPTELQRYSPDAGAHAQIKEDPKSNNILSRSLKNNLLTNTSSSSNTNSSSGSSPYAYTTTNGISTTINGVTNRSPELADFQLLEGKHRMFETISKIIINISQKKPLVMFLDDLHWADAASLHLLHYLARNIQNQPILILGAYRSEEVDYPFGAIHPLQEVITRLCAENLVSVIELDPLGHQQTVEMVVALLGVKNVPNDFVNLIYNETEGNPFFIKEVLRTLIEEGALSIRNEKLVLNIKPEEIVIPTSIKELIKLQLQRLDPDCREVIEYASVIGNEFNLQLLKNILAKPETELINILGKIIEAKIMSNVDEKGGFAWKFTHNKTHEVIYNEINGHKKRLIHLALAKYLEENKNKNLGIPVYNLAYHFFYGYDFEHALDYSIEGGEKAVRAYANKEALELYNIGLNSFRRLDDKLMDSPEYKEKKIEVLSKLGTLHITLGEWDKALDYYEQILPICEVLKDNRKKCKTYLNIGWLYQRRSYWEAAQKNFRKSLALADAIKDESITAEAYHGLGAVLEREGDFEQAIECYSISKKFAEKNDDYLNLAKSHNAFGRIYNQQGNHLKAIEHKKKSIYLFEKINNLPELAKAFTSLGLTYYDMGDMEKNIEFNEKCIELADEISDVRIKGYGLSNAVEALVKTEQLERAFQYTSDALEIFKKMDERFMIALNYMNFGIIFKHKKEWEKSKYYFKTTIEFMENLKIPYHLADCYRQFADMYRLKGEPPKTSYYLEKARELYQSISANKYVLEIDNELKKIII